MSTMQQIIDEEKLQLTEQEQIKLYGIYRKESSFGWTLYVLIDVAKYVATFRCIGCCNITDHSREGWDRNGLYMWSYKAIFDALKDKHLKYIRQGTEDEPHYKDWDVHNPNE